MKTKNIVSLAFFFSLTLLLCSCSEEETPHVDGDGNISEEEVQLLNLSAGQMELAANTNSFGLSLFRELNESRNFGDGSFVVSPLSASFLLGMLHDGAEGSTREEIERVLGFSGTDIGQVNDFFATVIGKTPAVDPGVSLAYANGIFVNGGMGYQLSPTFLQHMSGYYNASTMSLDFSDRDAALRYINDWVSLNTNGCIPTLLQDVNPQESVYMANATYMLAPWQQPFDKNFTNGGYFRRNYEYDRLLSFMLQAGNSFAVCSTEGYKAISMPYANGQFEMVIALPNLEKTEDASLALDRMIDGMDGLWMDDLDSSLKMYHNVEVAMPSFVTSNSLHLNDVLTTLGMPTAFTSEAQITGICMEENLHVDDVIQSVKIAVTEDGTEAAAGTLLEMAGHNLDDAFVFAATHPFAYFIREKQSGLIFFIGKYMGDSFDGI